MGIPRSNRGSMTIDPLDLLTKGLTWVGLFLVPIQATMLSIGVLVLLDLITGLWAAHKNGEVITSQGIRRTVSKTLAYQMAVIASFIMEQQFLMGIPVVRVVSGLIAVTEFKSLMENITKITGLDFMKEMIGKFQGKKIIPESKETSKVEESITSSTIESTDKNSISPAKIDPSQPKS